MIINSEQEMLNYGIKFAESLKERTPVVIELIGDVGAGKTTFVRGLAEGLGIKEPITSPSFTISKTYAYDNNKTLAHYDFYRLPEPGIMQEDLEDSIKNNQIIIVEWGESVADILPKSRLKIKIDYLENGSRNIELTENILKTPQNLDKEL